MNDARDMRLQELKSRIRASGYTIDADAVAGALLARRATRRLLLGYAEPAAQPITGVPGAAPTPAARESRKRQRRRR
jgi:hypothetical protein